MKCKKCGATLSQGERKCPLCLTPTDGKGEGTIPFFPSTPAPRIKEDFKGLLFLITLFFAISAGIVLTLDLIHYQTVTFSFYIFAPLALLYAAFVLPRWFRRPNPVIFLPIAFLVLMGGLLYLDLSTQGGWYLTFLLPVLGGFFLFLEAAVTLLYYLKKGRLYIFGGLFLAIAVFSFVGEILYRVTFSLPVCLTYSILPLIFFGVLGMGLIVIAIVPPFRRYFERRFFV